MPMLKLIAAIALLVAAMSGAAFAGGPGSDAKVQNPPTSMKGTTSQPPNHHGLPKCRSITTDTGQIIEICAE